MPRAATQLAGVVSSAVCCRENDMARFRTTEFKCGRGTEDSVAKRGFADHAVEMFYVNFVEPGNSQ